MIELYFNGNSTGFYLGDTSRKGMGWEKQQWQQGGKTHSE
jgi:hypothetical protein